MRGWTAGLAALTLTTAACGSGAPAGERRIGGDITFGIGSNYQILAYGVAVPSGELTTSAFTVLMSTAAVECSTDPQGNVGGDYVEFEPTSASPMVYPTLPVGVSHKTSGGYSYSLASGRVEITSVSAASVAGAITFMTDGSGGLITVNGTFEVVRCF